MQDLFKGIDRPKNNKIELSKRLFNKRMIQRQKNNETDKGRIN